MSSVSAIRQALSDTLEAGGVRCSPFVEASVDAPQAWIVPGEPFVQYRQTFESGADLMHFKVRMHVGRASDRAAQVQLDELIDSGTVPAILEGDLDGLVADVNVSQVAGYGEYVVGDISYLGCEFYVEVML